MYKVDDSYIHCKHLSVTWSKFDLSLSYDSSYAFDFNPSYLFAWRNLESSAYSSSSTDKNSSCGIPCLVMFMRVIL